MAIANTPRRHPERTFRLDVQGLRAVGALLVAAYHIWFGKVSGGVDVFFVISGFLVLGPLAEKCLLHGEIDLARFAGGLIKRIVPTTLFVLAACMLLAIIVIPATRWQPLSHQIFASALFYQNWQLASDSVDYLAREELPSLVQHYWAISVQVHFYVTMGLTIAGVGLFCRLARLPIAPLLMTVLLSIFAVSLSWSIYLTNENQSVAYFSTSTRIWEFCLGGLLYLGMPLVVLGDRSRLAMGWVGLIAIMICGAVLPASSSFPGYTALWPTVAACFVIAAGTTSSAFGADRILGSKPLQAVGRISFGFYLWHWPLLVIYRVVFDVVDIGLLGGLGIIIVGIVLAVATHHFVEQPARRLTFGSWNFWPAFALGVACILAVSGGVVAWVLSMKHERQQETATPLDQNLYPGPKVFETPSLVVEAAPLRPGRLVARSDRAKIYRDNCHQSLQGTEILSCTYGDPEAERTIALVGGSHSVHWLPALEAMMLDQPFRIVTYTKSSCLLSMKHYGNPDFEAPCLEWRDKVISELLETKPDIVFTTATKSGHRNKNVPESYIDVWRILEKADIKVVAIRDTPMMDVDVPECVEIRGPTSPQCSRPTILTEPNPFPAAAVTPLNVYFIDLSTYFCDQSSCPPTAGNILIYRDGHHLTATYSRALAPSLQPYVRAVFEGAKPGLLKKRMAEPDPGEPTS